VNRYFQNRATGQSKKLRTRGMLLDSALAVFYQGGIGNARLEDITRHAGMANATFYNHFKDKDTLVLELAKSMIAGLMEPMDAALVEVKDAPIRIVVLIHVVMRCVAHKYSWGWFLGQSFYLVPLKPDFGASVRFKVEVDLGLEQGSFSKLPDEFQLDQMTSVFLSGLRRLGKDDVNIIDRTSENILRLLGMTSDNAGEAVVQAQAFL
jgi:AcrR family transcriptional regulator